MRRLAPMCLSLAALLSMLGLARADGPAAPAAPDPVLAVVVDVLAPGADVGPAVQAATAADAQGAGFLGAAAARTVGDAPRLVRTTLWGSLEQAEDAALAADGRADVIALDALTDPARRRVLHARRVRTSAYREAAGGHLEVTLFRTRPGTTRAAHLARFDAAEADFARAEGVLGHALYLAPDGMWVHVVRWRSEADFATTGRALLRTVGVGGWIRSLDYGRFSVLRGDLLGR